MTRVLVSVALVMLAFWAVDHRAYVRGTASMSDAVTRARLQAEMLQESHDDMTARLERCVRAREADQAATQSALDGLMQERSKIETLAIEAIRALESQQQCDVWAKMPACADI